MHMHVCVCTRLCMCVRAYVRVCVRMRACVSARVNLLNLAAAEVKLCASYFHCRYIDFVRIEVKRVHTLFIMLIIVILIMKAFN